MKISGGFPRPQSIARVDPTARVRQGWPYNRLVEASQGKTR